MHNSQFPPVSAAKSTITDPYFMFSTNSFDNNFGAGLPGISAVVIIISTSLAYFKNNANSASKYSFPISLAYPPIPAPSTTSPFILTSKNSAPQDFTYSLVANLVSNALTIAPIFLAVTIADKPATPAPITNTLAGGTFPAAVI